MIFQLFDMETMEVLKTYKTERPVNSASMSPLFDHVSTLNKEKTQCSSIGASYSWMIIGGQHVPHLRNMGGHLKILEGHNIQMLQDEG